MKHHGEKINDNNKIKDENNLNVYSIFIKQKLTNKEYSPIFIILNKNV